MENEAIEIRNTTHRAATSFAVSAEFCSVIWCCVGTMLLLGCASHRNPANSTILDTEAKENTPNRIAGGAATISSTQPSAMGLDSEMDTRLREFGALSEISFPKDVTLLGYYREGLNRYLKIHLPKANLTDLLHNSPFRDQNLDSDWHSAHDETYISWWRPEEARNFLAGAILLKSVRGLVIEVDFDGTSHVTIYLHYFVI